MQSSIIADSLVKDYGKQRAVDAISLTVGEGEFFGFLGPNGAGKSTTIKMMTGMLKPTSGSVSVCGFEMATQPLEVKRVIGILPEENSLYERLSGREMLRFSGQMYGLDPKETERRTGDLLSVMELSADADKLIIDYSMGMKKKVALAAALIHKPRVLFLDEPFNGIDPISVRAIRDVLEQLRQHGTTIFFTSHVMEVVERLCTRIAIIQKGKLAAIGTLDELRTQSGEGGALEDVFLKLVDARTKEAGNLEWL
jgi:ABC-2 type transport system ATP-binding protein